MNVLLKKKKEWEEDEQDWYLLPWHKLLSAVNAVDYPAAGSVRCGSVSFRFLMVRGESKGLFFKMQRKISQIEMP